MQTTVTPAGKQVAGGLGALMEGATGKSLGGLVASTALAGSVSADFIDVVANVIDGALELVIDAVTETVADAIGSVLNVIPVLGQLAGLVVDIVVGMLTYSADQVAASEQAREQAKASAMNKLIALLNPMCNAELAYAQQNIVPTSPDGKTPADMFRPIYYRWKRGGGALPLTPLSIIVMLCGPEADGWAFSESSYEQFIEEARTGVMYNYAEENVPPIGKDEGKERYRFHGRFVGQADEGWVYLTSNPIPEVDFEANKLGLMRGRMAPCEKQVGRDGRIVPDPGLGLKPHVRRRLWELVRAVFSATQDPGPRSFVRRGDGGRAAMSLILDILFRHYEPVARDLFGDTDGYWTPYLAKCMEHRITTLPSYRRKKSSVDTEYGKRYRAVGSCTSNLSGQFIDFINAYREQFIPKFLDANGRWLNSPKDSPKVPASSRARLILTGKDAAAFSGKIKKASTYVEPITIPQKILLATAGLGGSYLAYRGIKTGARLLRARKHRR
jgi:hypothetical protein